MPEHDAEVDLVRRIFAVQAERGIEGVIERFDEFCTPDFVWIPATGQALAGAEHQGREGLETWWRAFTESFADVQFEASDHRATGNSAVLTLGHTSARGAGSGIPIEWDFSQLNRVRDGRTFWAQAWASHEEGEEAARAEA